MNNGGFALIGLVWIVWYISTIIQTFLAYGTAYRKTKANGDTGASLFGWLLVYGFVAAIPYLGYYFWKKSNEANFR